MQIVIAGKDPTYLEDYLIESGHNVKSFYVNDLSLNIAKAFNPDVFIYMEDVVAKIPHEQALKLIQSYRVLIIATKENSIIPYAAALGIKDFVFQPCELSTILNRINQPADSNDAAEMLRYVPGLRAIEKTERIEKVEKKGLFSRSPKKEKIYPTPEEPISIIYSDQNDFKSIKKGILLDLGGVITKELEPQHPDIWKSDWRLELRAEPVKLISGSMFYGQANELGDCGTRDDAILIDFIYHISAGKKPLYIIDPGRYTEALLRLGIPVRNEEYEKGVK